jgi:hypothetical protein
MGVIEVDAADYEVDHKTQSAGRRSTIGDAGPGAIGIDVRGYEIRGQPRAAFQVLDRTKSDEFGSATAARL